MNKPVNQTAHIQLIINNPCPFCDRAKVFLKNKGLKFDIIDLTGNPSELNAWKNKTGWKTVPMILINDKLIGGYVDLKALEEEGQLDSMVMG